MITLLPYGSFVETATSLDYVSLNHQRCHAARILRIIERKRRWTTNQGPIAFADHPAVLQWEGFEPMLELYHDTIVNEWVRRGYANNFPRRLSSIRINEPPWLHKYQLIISHRSLLLRKNPEHYYPFGWRVRPDISLYWPVMASGESDYPVCEEILYNQRRLLCHTR